MSISVLPFPSGKPGRDLLEQPVVPVRVAERRVHEVRAPFYRLEAWGPLLVYLADVDAAADEIVPGGVDVLDREKQPVKGTRLSPQRDALAEVDRALRVGRRHLHRPEVVAGGQVGVQPPSEALIEALCPVNIGDGQRHHLERHVDRPRFRHLRRTCTAYVRATHAYLQTFVGRARHNRATPGSPTRAARANDGHKADAAESGLRGPPRARLPGRPLGRSSTEGAPLGGPRLSPDPGAKVKGGSCPLNVSPC